MIDGDKVGHFFNHEKKDDGLYSVTVQNEPLVSLQDRNKVHDEGKTSGIPVWPRPQQEDFSTAAQLACDIFR